MLGINESVKGYDLAELLNAENGIFEATAPSGEKYQVISRAGHSITNFRQIQGRSRNQEKLIWNVRKIGELRLEQDTA